jgi:kynureninase
MSHPRAEAEALDAEHPLAEFRDRFLLSQPDRIYLDGNSLGRVPRATVERLTAAVRDEWGGALVEGWDAWIDLPTTVGDRLARAALGAAPGQVVVADSTTVNLYGVAGAALAAAPPARRVVVADTGNFATDRYVLQGLAHATGGEVRWVDVDRVDGPTLDTVTPALGADVALLCLSAVSFTSGALADVEALTAAAHGQGAVALWDLSHAAGAVPLDLDGWRVDAAVGCTYKYLNAGPGAPAYTYVARRNHQWRPPIWGWFAQQQQFAMARDHMPVEGVGRFLTGTPNILGLMAVDEGVKLVADAGINRIRAASMSLTDYLVALAEEWLVPLGFRVASPREAQRRGGHVALAHPDAPAISTALRSMAGVVADLRAPDLLRLAPTPLDTRFVDVWDGLDRIRRLVESGDHARVTPASRVT